MLLDEENMEIAEDEEEQLTQPGNFSTNIKQRMAFRSRKRVSLLPMTTSPKIHPTAKVVKMTDSSTCLERSS
jgi:hypothetical protein